MWDGGGKRDLNLGVDKSSPLPGTILHVPFVSRDKMLFQAMRQLMYQMLAGQRKILAEIYFGAVFL